MPKILVVFSSIFGANAALAAEAEKALESEGAEVRVRGVPQLVLGQHEVEAAKAYPDATEEDVLWADGYVFTSPVHTASLSASLKAFVDSLHDGAVAGKYENRTFTGMVTAELRHSGQEIVAKQLNNIGEAWGCVVVAPSTASLALNELDGNAFGLSFTLDKGKLPEGIGPVLSDHLSRFAQITNAMVPARNAGRSADKASSVPTDTPITAETDDPDAPRHSISSALG
ncbi:flavodoxin family protein [Actinomyces minihominis]|uniref:flavodoxin family protein n=1 Tax=Actinomyces minihominis TaxID=2002838 RepID=UPI0013EE24B8|nr:NAD(P)H-dependent oxidoreductase [Actinomyces minihominis]